MLWGNCSFPDPHFIFLPIRRITKNNQVMSVSIMPDLPAVLWRGSRDPGAARQILKRERVVFVNYRKTSRMETFPESTLWRFRVWSLRKYKLMSKTHRLVFAGERREGNGSKFSLHQSVIQLWQCQNISLCLESVEPEPLHWFRLNPISNREFGDLEDTKCSQMFWCFRDPKLITVKTQTDL